jgi:hypothetical protein
MTYFVEIRATVQRTGRPRLVPLTEVGNYHGFRSVFAYSSELVARIEAMGAMRDLRGSSVYADTLFMDFDGHDPSAFRTWLTTSGLAWDEFDSGNRSVHFHIPIEPVEAVWVPEAMKLWTKKHAPTADISFLHPAGQYRLPGTYHAKQPGRRKELVQSGLGVPLVLERPSIMPRIAAFTDEDVTPEQFFSMLLVTKGEGQRRPWLWHCATIGAEAGLSFDELFEGLLVWNAHCCLPPHDKQTVMKQTESAFRRLSHRG